MYKRQEYDRREQTPTQFTISIHNSIQRLEITHDLFYIHKWGYDKEKGIYCTLMDKEAYVLFKDTPRILCKDIDIIIPHKEFMDNNPKFHQELLAWKQLIKSPSGVFMSCENERLYLLKQKRKINTEPQYISHSQFEDLQIKDCIESLLTKEVESIFFTRSGQSFLGRLLFHKYQSNFTFKINCYVH